MCEQCEWVNARYQGKLVMAHEVETNWPWTERNELEEWSIEDGFEDE